MHGSYSYSAVDVHVADGRVARGARRREVAASVRIDDEVTAALPHQRRRRRGRARHVRANAEEKEEAEGLKGLHPHLEENDAPRAPPNFFCYGACTPQLFLGRA